MRIASEEEDALLLCRQRLHNVIGILAIRETPALVAGEVSTGSGEVPEPGRQCGAGALYAFK